MRTLTGLATGLVLVMAVAAPALAATPARHACAGRTVSMHAGPGYGQFVKSIATDDRGVGEEVQLILAGELPDEAFDNTCND